MHLYVIRHGQSHVNLPDWTGDVDAGLTPLGEQQAAALAEWLPKNVTPIDAIYCSTMRRPRETVAPSAAAYGITPVFDDRLREVGNSNTHGEPFTSQNAPTMADWLSFDPTVDAVPFVPVARTPDTETVMHFRLRVSLFLESMIVQHRDQRVLAFCHGGVMDAIFDHCFGIGPWRRAGAFTNNTGISHFQYITRAGLTPWLLYSHNQTEHLRGLENGLTY